MAPTNSDTQQIISPMATYLARQCPQCNGYLGIVLREPGRNVPVRLSTGTASNAITVWLGLSSKGRLPITNHEGTHMLDPLKTLEREALLRRHRELQAEIAQPL